LLLCSRELFASSVLYNRILLYSSLGVGAAGLISLLVAWLHFSARLNKSNIYIEYARRIRKIFGHDRSPETYPA
jgi:hypothetical protein